MSQALEKTITVVLAGVIGTLAGRLTEQWFGAPVEFTTLAAFIFVYWAILRLFGLAAQSKLAPRPAKQPDTRESLELLDKKWDIRGKYGTAILAGLLLFAFIATILGMLVYALWLWIF